MFSTAYFARFFRIAAQTMERNREELCNYDAELGDGDIGITMAKGFGKIYETIEGRASESIGGLFREASMVLMNTVPSTMGTLIAGSFFRISTVFSDAKDLSYQQYVQFFKVLIEGLQKRGKADRGDKTILDSLFPVLDYLETFLDDPEGTEQDIRKILEEMLLCAKRGVEETKNMTAKFGRASRYLDKSKGHIDAGAVVGMLLVQSLVEGF